MKTYHFIIGLPRSGSTVLSSILNQHPSVYVTPTSPLLDMLIAVQNEWHRSPSVIANPFPQQLTNVIRAMIGSAWEHRPENIIIDRCRGWGKNLPASTILFEKEIKCVATVRDLPSIMASWLKVMEGTPGNYMDVHLKQHGLPINRETRTMGMWHNMVKDCMEGIVCAKKDASNRLFVVDYDNLVDHPQRILQAVTTFLELPPFDYDINNIVNDHEDDDLKAWGMSGLHSIRPRLEKTAKHPKDILGDYLYNTFVELAKKY